MFEMLIQYASIFSRARPILRNTHSCTMLRLRVSASQRTTMRKRWGNVAGAATPRLAPDTGQEHF